MFRFIAERGSLVEALVSVSPLTVLKNRNRHQVEQVGRETIKIVAR
jgi:hypothetical protein